MPSLLCFLCHSTVSSETSEAIRHIYKEIVGISIRPDSHLCHICCHVLNKLWLFRAICLKRSLGHPVLYNEKGTLNLRRNQLVTISLSSEGFEHSNNFNHKVYNFYYGDDSVCSEESDRYVKLEEDNFEDNSSQADNDNIQDTQEITHTEIDCEEMVEEEPKIKEEYINNTESIEMELKTEESIADDEFDNYNDSNDEECQQRTDKEMDNVYINSIKTNRGGVKLNWNGFIYEKNRAMADKQYWICELRSNKKYQCRSRIITAYDEEKNMYKLLNTSNKEHNHGPDPLRAKIRSTINKLKNDALLNIEKKPIHVIEQCVASTSATVLPNLPSSLSLRQLIYRQRNKLDKLKEPNSMDFEINREYLKMNDDEDVLIDKRFNDKRIIIYTSKKLLKLLCSSVYLVMDGTFKVASNIFKYIYAIHGCVNSETFPMVITLSTHKDKLTYDQLFSCLIEYCDSQNLILSPKFILMDFDKASQLSAKSVFENAIIKGRYFHLSQIIYKQVQSIGFQKLYGTDETFSSEIKGILALAYLSDKEIPVYFDEWIKNISLNALIIANWFKENYISGNCSSPPEFEPKIWSTYELNENNIPRTQNRAESWHNRFQNLIGQNNIGFYALSKKILLEIKKPTAEIEKYQNGNTPVKKKRKYSDETDQIENVLMKKCEYKNKFDFLRDLTCNIKLI